MPRRRVDGARQAEARRLRTVRDLLQFSQRELMVLWPDFLGWDTTANATRTIDATAIALGLRAKLDEQRGWQKTLSNVGINGVTLAAFDAVLCNCFDAISRARVEDPRLATLVMVDLTMAGSRRIDDSSSAPN